MRVYLSVFILTFLLLQSSCRLVDNTIKRRGISSENPTDSTPTPAPSDPAALLKQWKATLPVAFTNAVTIQSTLSLSADLDVNKAGEAIVVWAQTDGSKKQVFKSEYRSGSWTHPANLNDNISPDGQDAAGARVSMNENGDAVIVWYQSDGSNNQVFKSEYRSGSWTHPTGLTDNISPDGQNAQVPRVSLSDNGDTVIAWVQSDGTNNQIFKSEYRSGSWTHPTGLTDNISPDGQATNVPEVDINSTGEALIVWYQNDGTNDQIFKSEYRSGVWTHPANLTDNISPDGLLAKNPQVKMNNSGDSLIVWQQLDGTAIQIFKSEYRSGAWTHPSGLTDNISPDGQNSDSPKVDINTGGEAIIVWSQNDGTDDQIFKSEYRSGAWTHPANLADNISPAGQDALYPEVSLNTSGEAIIAWQQSDGFTIQVFKSEYRSGAWTHPSGLSDNISPDGAIASGQKVRMDDSGNALITSFIPFYIYVSEYRSGSWTHPITIVEDSWSVKNQQALAPQLAVNASGDAVVVWAQSDGAFVDQIFKSEYRSGTWTHPSSLADNISPDGQQASAPVVSMNTTGDTLIAWYQNDGSKTQIFKSEYRSGAWTHPANLTDNISPNGSTARHPNALINDSGEALIAWIQQDGVLTYQLFKSEYRSGAWTHPVNSSDNISTDLYDVYSASQPQIGLNNSGEALIVWDQLAPGAVYQAFKSEYRSGAWTHPSSITDNISPDGQNTLNSKLSLNDSGEAIIVWTQSDGTNNQIFKSEYRSGAWTHPSGLTDNISPDGQAASNPLVSLNDSGNAMIVWQQSNGTNETFFKSEYSSGSWTHPSSLSDHMLLGTQTATDIKMSLNNTNQAIITWTDGSYRILSTDNFSGSWVDPYYVKSTTTPYINYEFIQSKTSEKGYLLFSEKSGDTKKNGIQLYEFKQ